jgi:hypothetical protein
MNDGPATPSFDIVVAWITSGSDPHKDAVAVLRWIEAGATWWLEGIWDDQVSTALQARGYTTLKYPDWDNLFGAVGAVFQADGKLLGGSDPPEETWAEGK